MKKLNNKGYLLVEIIVASVLAMTIAYFLIELTLNLKAKNDDVFVDTILVTDKMLMTDTIQEDIGRYRVTKLSQPSDSMLDITYQINGSDVTKRISIESIDDRYLFKYGIIDASGNYDDTVYQKEFNEALDVDRIILSNSCYNEASDTYVACSSSADNGNGIMTIKISAYTLYSDKDYGINISVPYKTNDIVVEEYTGPREIVDEIKELGTKDCEPINGPAMTDEGVCTTEDDYGTSYVFRGTVENNYVKFGEYQTDVYYGYYHTSDEPFKSYRYAIYDSLNECESAGLYHYNMNCTLAIKKGTPMYWRIIRINGDNTIRMIYDGITISPNNENNPNQFLGVSEYNNSGAFNDDNVDMGYMYGKRDASSYDETHANVNDSIVKTKVDNWYKNQFKNSIYEKYIADNLFCNDRSITTTGSDVYDYYNNLGYGENPTYYSAFERMYHMEDIFDVPNVPQKVSLMCKLKNDRFTADDTSKGNGALTYPVGLISGDEAIYAGVFPSYDSHTDVFNHYLNAGVRYWTMTPEHLTNAPSSGVYYITEHIGVGCYITTANDLGVKPVISLKADTIFSGTGTMEDPYVVEMDK